MSRAKKNLKKGAVCGRDLVIANPKKRSRSEWCQSIQNFLENKMDKKNLKKDAVDGHHLVITVKLAQFLTDRAESGTSRFKMLPGASWAKKIEKWGEKKIQGRGRDQGVI